MFEIAFLIFALAFYIKGLNDDRNDEETRYQRGIREMREFGRRVSTDKYDREKPPPQK